VVFHRAFNHILRRCRLT
jgi:hypothetical protein